MNECLKCGPRGLRDAFNKPADGKVVPISVGGGNIKAGGLNEPHARHVHRPPAERAAWNQRSMW